MEWVKIIGDALEYIEKHITEDLDIDDIAKAVNVSPFYFQKGFVMLCGFTVAEYVRNRKLALAGNDIATSNEKIIDIALKYGYDSPDGFTKAFTRFHGITPMAARKDSVLLKSFAPLKIKFSLEGGYILNYRIEKKEAFTVVGNAKEFTYEDAKVQVPKFWQEHFACGRGKVVMGTYGVNLVEQFDSKTFEYLIADPYKANQEVPEGFVVKTIPVFPCVGPLPRALQDVNVKIFAEWLPALREYDFVAGYCVEYYDDSRKYEKGTLDDKYYCEIWIPVKKKQLDKK